jgi:hypothetical protein
MNQRHLLTVLKLSLAAVLMAAIGASQAHAQDSKVYPGLMCVKRVANAASPVYDERGTFGNDSTTDWLHVGCPIVRDGGFKMTSAWVEVVDLNSDELIECRIIRAYRCGTTACIRYSYLRNSSGPGTVAWGSLSELGSPGGLSHYLVSCIIPPKAQGVSKIVTYQATGN